MLLKMTCIPVLLFVAFAAAQTANNFTLTASDGKSYDLYTMLGQGKHVVIHFTSIS